MMRLKKQVALLLLGASVLLIFGGVPALAAPVTFSANTAGTFGAGGTGGTVSPSGTSITIGSTTISFASLPSEINVGLEPGGSSNVTLGVFNATSTALTNVAGATFTLNVTFTLPTDASPKPAVYTATLSGSISGGASGAAVNWSTTSITFTSPTAGTFTLQLEPSTPINSPLSPDASRIRGTITYNNAAIPEPLTLLTLGSGLAGLAALTGRRRKKD